ncbi:MAG: hypothetical protein ACP6IS_07975 [Candidatus Asgardarchaeia archaeon]
MISILYDNKSISRELIALLRRLPKDEVAIINIPSADFTLKSGIHISPSLIALVKRLAKKKIRVRSKFSYLLKEFEILDREIPDFDLAVAISETLWMKNNMRLFEFYKRISLILNVEFQLYPLLDPPPSVVIRTNSGDYDPLSFHKLRTIPEIKSIDFENLDKANIVKETKEILQNSDKVILFQTYPISLHLLNSMGGLKKLIENFKGHILYLLPKRITKTEQAILNKLGYEPSVSGLIIGSHDKVDAVLFDQKQSVIIENSSKYEVSLLPLEFSTGTKENLEKFVEDLIKILYQQGS